MVVIILDLSHPIVWLVRHVCSNKAEFSFLQKKTNFLMRFQKSTKLTFGLSDVIVVTVIASNGSLFFCDRILWFSKNMPQSLKSHPPSGLITVIIIFIMKEKNYHKKISSPFSIQEFDFIYSIFFRVCIL